MQMIDFQDIEHANSVLEEVVKHTSLKKSKTFSEMSNANVFLKMENLQPVSYTHLRAHET